MPLPNMSHHYSKSHLLAISNSGSVFFGGKGGKEEINFCETFSLLALFIAHIDTCKRNI